MFRNVGAMPKRCFGKRVHVVLRDGYDTRSSGLDPIGWAADRQRWTLTGNRADIVEWEFVA